MPFFFVMILLRYLGGNLYIFGRGAHWLGAQPLGWKIVWSIGYWGCALLFLVSFLGRQAKLPLLHTPVLQELGTGWLVFTLYMVLGLLLFDLLKVINIRFNHSFITSLILTLICLGYGYYHYQHPKVSVVNRVINKPLITGSATSLRVVAVSDLHLGYATDKAKLARYVELINRQQPDLILIGGDLIDHDVAPVVEQRMEEELNRLRAPTGIYAVPGNHEYISGLRPCLDFFNTTPIVLLRDSVVTLPNGLQIVGRDDRHHRRRKALSELASQLDPARPAILLDHQPYELAETAEAGIDLQFSGHTHRGQVWPLNWLTDYLFEVSHGAKEMGQTLVYVSSGLSLWGPPFRIGTDSELVVFQLTFSSR